MKLTLRFGEWIFIAVKRDEGCFFNNSFTVLGCRINEDGNYLNMN